MWTKPWQFIEGMCIGGGLVLIGCVLQLFFGAINWNVFAYPLNVLLLFIYVGLLYFFFLFRYKIYVISWMGHYTSAVSALVWTVMLTLFLGLLRQHSEADTSGWFGVRHLLSSWSFVLVYVWLTTVLGLVILKRLAIFSWRNIPFLLNHLGLFVVMTCGTLGNADIQELRIQLKEVKYRAINEQCRICRLPFSVELQQFKLEEYSQRLVSVDLETGEISEESVSADKEGESGVLSGWEIHVEKVLPEAVSDFIADSIIYVAGRGVGTTSAVYVEARNIHVNEKKQGWVSCGNFMHPSQTLFLDSKYCIVMPEQEPLRYVSRVSVCTEKGERIDADIEVNKPLKVDGWKIYQVDYDREKGRWSKVSIFKLVYNPWAIVVYAGIAMMMAGAVSMIFVAGKRKENGL